MDLREDGANAHTAHGCDVAMVIVDGRFVVEHGQATQVDQDAIRPAAADAARALWQRAM